jgi:hypothetical protein
MLRRPDSDAWIRDVTRDQAGIRAHSGGVRCPLCEWRPVPSSRWSCSQCPVPEGLTRGCGTVWNTFETSGVCPGCFHHWQWTSCLACGGWSLHEAWYVLDPDAHE